MRGLGFGIGLIRRMLAYGHATVSYLLQESGDKILLTSGGALLIKE